MTTPQVDPRGIALTYLSVWNEADQETRLAVLEESWSPNVRYADPLMRGETPAGVAAMIEAARGQFPGHSFVLRGEPDGHGNAVRFSWDLVSTDGAKAAAGSDIVKLTTDGKLEEVIGFLD